MYKALEMEDIKKYLNVEFLIEDRDISFLKSFLNDSSTFAFVAVEEGLFVGVIYGYILQKPFNEPMFYIHSLDVDVRYRRRGIGTKLMEKAIRYGEELGCYKGFVITNQSNEYACKVYEKLGGIRTHQDDVVYEYKKRD
jgi:ribosomal protein S18 acetylase RimI-like enzyme